jgi:hypothetical protein
MYSWLLLVSAIGLGALAVLILYNLIELIRLYRCRRPARLTLRLAGIFAVLAITPVALVYRFSLHFLQRGIDSWFNVQVDRGLEDALELSRTAMDLRMRDVLKQTARMAKYRGERRRAGGPRLDEMLDLGEASELTLFGRRAAGSSPPPRWPLAILPHSAARNRIAASPARPQLTSVWSQPATPGFISGSWYNCRARQ